MYCLISSLCHTVNPFLHHFDSFCVAFFLISCCFLLFVSSHACTGRLAHSLVILILSAPLHSHVCTYVCVCVCLSVRVCFAFLYAVFPLCTCAANTSRCGFRGVCMCASVLSHCDPKEWRSCLFSWLDCQSHFAHTLPKQIHRSAVIQGERNIQATLHTAVPSKTHRTPATRPARQVTTDTGTHFHLCNLTCGKLHLFSLFINLHPADYLTFKLKLILKTMFTLNQRTKRETTDSMLKTDPPSYKWGAGIHKTVNTTLLLAVYPGVFCSSCFGGLTT